ncbi:hypothetical protein AB0M86_47600 [Streptomyces sp. NPDC051639]|uniref:hypothetical protein n=1 Tax=Streptomyces sp. NPDC051639 TaxID=3155671 RepID=UPI00342150D2
MSGTENVCAREGCSFHAELVMIGETPLSAVYCGDACADFSWLRRALEASEPSTAVAECWQNLNALERILNARSEPFSVGPLIGESLYAG